MRQTIGNTAANDREELLYLIVKIVRNHPDPARAEYVLMDMLERICKGEDQSSIETLYAEDLKFLRRAVKYAE